MATDGVDEVEAMISALSITAPLATSSAATPLRETQKLRPCKAVHRPTPIKLEMPPMNASRRASLFVAFVYMQP
ncbi:hypothetical protein N7450_008004 [Penicillium hetheringtonii]|uniref:Uncharacterized protein n=1 Tax=Penicillium hetheringtonii TaxID=911720 RepID=A0AAD6DFI5_9EURO|nr:hypothetical protein N7450_008004 [Penicillium hetheringtonii]